MGLSQQCPKSISVGAVTNDNHVLRASVRPGTSTSSTPRLRAHPCPCSAGTDRAAIKAPRGTFKLPCLFFFASAFHSCSNVARTQHGASSGAQGPLPPFTALVLGFSPESQNVPCPAANSLLFLLFLLHFSPSFS